MITDGQDIPAGSEIECDLCIIGAGAAGIAIAREFLQATAKVVVLESGGFEADGDTQALYDGPQDGVPYPDTLYSSRLRYFGGSTNHWGAWCAPWRESDFHERPWAAHSGWPIGLADIAPYYRKAFALCRLQAEGDWVWGGDEWAARLGIPNPFRDSAFEVRATQQTRPRFEIQRFSFGIAYRGEIAASRSVQVLLHANAMDLKMADGANRIGSLAVGCLTGNRFSVRAQAYVLATGGVENARLLLASRSGGSRGIGNEFDNVGRYFMDHIYVPVTARLFPTQSDPRVFQLMQPNDSDQGAVYCHIGTTDQFLARERMKDSYVALFPHLDPDYVAASESAGVEALHEALSSLRAGDLPAELGTRLGEMATDADDILLSLFRKVVHGGIPVLYYDCMVRIDPTPVRDSRITLIDEVDALGMPRAKLTWAVHQQDKVDIARLIEIFGREVGRLGLGRVQHLFDPDQPFPDDLHIGWHHMGTTRMSGDPRSGVVDRHCRVHAIDNLYVAGSSVFATSGSGTPTMMIVALALRLADHLKVTRGMR